VRHSAIAPSTFAALALATILALPSRASAEEVQVGGKPLLIDVTNTSVFNYHFDNRNTIAARPATIVDDQYGEWLDRFNLQLSYWRFRLGVRIDTAAYVGTLKRLDVPSFVASKYPDEQDPNDRANDFFRELAARYVNTYYPSKLYVGYAQRGVDVTAGDFYVQVGRGLVFSVRKIDELAIDTTVRGVKAVVDHDFGDLHLGAMLFGGLMNPLRIDEMSGRRLNGGSSALFFGFPQASDIRYFATNHNNQYYAAYEPAKPSYLEDGVVGGHLEGGNQSFMLGANGAMVKRRELFENASGESLKHATNINFSGSLNVPNIAKHGDAYVEVAGQQLRDGSVDNSSGYAVYVNANAHGGGFNVALEAKHYRSFFPIGANVDSTTKGSGAPEFSVLAYSQPPIAEPIYTEPVSGGAPSLCISGGWANVDYRFSPAAKVFGWLGGYASWSDLESENCQIDSKKQTNTWDMAIGSEVFLEKRQSHGKAWVGARTTDCSDEHCNNTSNGKTANFYREGYIRYDLVKHISGPFALQMQGLHRHRYEQYSFDEPFNEGENYTALQWSPHLSAVFGYEYLARPGCAGESDAKVCHYFNGGLQWRSASSEKLVDKLLDTVNVFVGQRRGGLRCVSGVCRPFPPFEGAKIELVSRF
jgi:hypothetical protein